MENTQMPPELASEQYERAIGECERRIGQLGEHLRALTTATVEAEAKLTSERATLGELQRSHAAVKEAEEKAVAWYEAAADRPLPTAPPVAPPVETVADVCARLEQQRETRDAQGQAYREAQGIEAPKRKPGRPKGSKSGTGRRSRPSKPVIDTVEVAPERTVAERQRAKRGSKKTGRKPGRPKGSGTRRSTAARPAEETAGNVHELGSTVQERIREAQAVATGQV